MQPRRPAWIEKHWHAQCAAHGGTAHGDCCQRWHRKVNASFAKQAARYAWQPNTAALRSTYGRFHSDTPHDMVEPSWSCEALDRVPWLPGDGPKWMCGPDVLANLKHCLVYSFGSNGDVTFERAIKQRAPNCAIHTFDPSLNAEKRVTVARAESEGVLSFHEAALAGPQQKSLKIGETRFQGHTLDEIWTHLGHAGRFIHVLKVDVEGSEHSALGGIGQCSGIGRSGQLLLEIHDFSTDGPFRAGPGAAVQRLVQSLEACGLQLFHKEPNVWGCGGKHCFEASLVNAQHAFLAFGSTHCWR